MSKWEEGSHKKFKKVRKLHNGSPYLLEESLFSVYCSQTNSFMAVQSSVTIRVIYMGGAIHYIIVKVTKKKSKQNINIIRQTKNR